MKNKKVLRMGIIAGAAAIVVLVILGLLGVFKGKQTESAYQVEAAKIGNISVSVGGTGTVRANQTANLTWETSGKVSDIYVQKGQQVNEDEVLAALDSTSLSQSIILAQIDLINAKEALDKAINNTEARADAHLALIQSEQALEDAQDDAESKLYQRASQETIDIARANLITANQALDDAEEIYNRTRGSGEDTIVYAAGLSQYAQARQEQTRATYNLRYVQDLPDPLSVEEVNAKLEQVKAQYLTAKEEWEKVKDGPNEEDIQAAQAKVDSAQAALDMAQVNAPFAGTITDVENKAGDLVSMGSKAFQVDDLSHLLVDVDISEVDINQIEIGQKVSMNFDAITEQDFSGTVSDIAMYGTNNGGAIEFSITVEIDNPTADIKPGMTAAVNVVVKQLDDVLLVPSRAVRTMNGKRVIYVLQNNFPMPVQITLGASADSYSQILSGEVKKGDQIVINPPTDLSNFGPGMGGGMQGGE